MSNMTAFQMAYATVAKRDVNAQMSGENAYAVPLSAASWSLIQALCGSTCYTALLNARDPSCQDYQAQFIESVFRRACQYTDSKNQSCYGVIDDTFLVDGNPTLAGTSLFSYTFDQATATVELRRSAETAKPEYSVISKINQVGKN